MNDFIHQQHTEHYRTLIANKLTGHPEETTLANKCSL